MAHRAQMATVDGQSSEAPLPIQAFRHRLERLQEMAPAAKMPWLDSTVFLVVLAALVCMPSLGLMDVSLETFVAFVAQCLFFAVIISMAVSEIRRWRTGATQRRVEKLFCRYIAAWQVRHPGLLADYLRQSATPQGAGGSLNRSLIEDWIRAKQVESPAIILSAVNQAASGNLNIIS